ncbi:MAG: histidinol-phosphate transaminase [Candidatus Sericytochromatia bacterium]|nr:histidinol-phosphate transaminase [Candidatus Sericytochromatia bacterium]
MRLVPDYIEQLEPYKAGKPIDEVQRELGLVKVTKLASNENPLGPSPKALAAIRHVLPQSHLYPDPGGFRLRTALAERFRVKNENIILGAGSEGIMGSIVRTFLHDDEEALTSEGTFIGFFVLARSQGIKIRTVPLKNFGYDLVAMAAAITPKTKIIYLANPNNPTGTIFHREEFETFLRQVPDHVLIILDEAYYEYCQHVTTYPDSQFFRKDNVITLRTFSKAYGLAGIRVGYGLAHEDLIKQLLKVKFPFEPSSVGQAAAIAALSDTAFLQKTLTTNAKGIQQLSRGLKDMGIRYTPSYANFLLTEWDSPEVVADTYNALLQRGVIVRPLTQFGLPTCLRISVGRQAENATFLKEMLAILSA